MEILVEVIADRELFSTCLDAVKEQRRAQVASCGIEASTFRRARRGTHMDFNLSETQVALQETAHRFALDVVRPKAAHYDEVAEFPRELIGAGYELGLINMTIPADLGGVGLSHFDQALVAEELAWGCSGVATSMIANDLALLPILLAGTEEQKRKFAAPLAQSLKLASF